MNKKVLKTLEYDKIIDMLVEEADSALGKDSARRLRPSSDHGEIVAMQAETSHALTRLFHHGAWRTSADWGSFGSCQASR